MKQKTTKIRSLNDLTKRLVAEYKKQKPYDTEYAFLKHVKKTYNKNK